MTAAPRVKFDPDRYAKTMKMRGTTVKYLPASKKIHFMYARFPDAQLTVEPHELTDTYAIVKATATLPNGASAQAYARVDKKDFGDYLEKADTKAKARACGNLGFEIDGPYDEFAEGYEAVADEDDIPTSDEDDQPGETPAPSTQQIVQRLIDQNRVETTPAPAPHPKSSLKVEENDIEKYPKEWTYPITEEFFASLKSKEKVTDEDADFFRSEARQSGLSPQGFLRYIFHAQEEAYTAKRLKVKPRAFATINEVPAPLIESVLEWITDIVGESAT